MLRMFFRLVEQYRFRALLGLLLLVFLLYAGLQEGGVVRHLLLALTALIFIGALYATRDTGQIFRVGTGVTLIWWAVTIARFAGNEDSIGAAIVASLVVVVLVAWCTFKALFLEAKADGDALAGAIFGYFLLAILWATLFDALEVGHPGSFALTGADDQMAELLYFSLVTITTLGYGDVLPISITARMLVGLEAAFGTLYIAILIGRIVGAIKPRSGH